MILLFDEEALAEYEAAAKWYASHSQNLGLRFVENVESLLSQIENQPEAFRRFEGQVRRALTRVFPYAVIYFAEADRILILAVMHCHRRPGYWRDRMRTDH